ncbi:MobP3 family relaxase [Caproicibacter fermentans]|uniref:MobP3 family relaxase n=1 Tax=Caproicibacter fermentans TaxID=2576756 RepID=UPI001E2FE378|nr:MobP3 family relaxase [Caproicibacter fermentans]
MRYIATRPRVAKNEGMNHGLFGKLTPGLVTEFQDWRDVARLVYTNSKKHITMYRGVISFDEQTAAELNLTDQKAWQRYIENHIMTIAEKNNIRRENLQWACALHQEKNHPHIHVVFWDTSSRVRNPFIPPAIPNAIRKQLIKDTFADKIRAFGEQKNKSAAELRSISNDLVDEFEQHLRRLDKSRYKRFREDYDEDRELTGSFDFDDEVLSETADRVFRIKAALPATGRIAYQLLPPNVKELVDELVAYLLKSTPALQKQKEDYIESKMKMALLYGGSDEYLSELRDRFAGEADKIIANRVLGMVKTLGRLDSELHSEEYHAARRSYYAEQMLMEALDMLSLLSRENNRRFENLTDAIGGDLSKEAKKELFLKLQDKGYEH